MTKPNYSHLLSAKKAATEEDEDENKHAATPPENDKEDGKKGKKAKKAAKEGNGDEHDEDDEEDRTDDDGDDEDHKKKGKKAKAEIREAVLAERARCSQIFSHEAAAGRPHVAAHLAFHTNMSAEDAIGTMVATAQDASAKPAQPANARRSIDERMANVRSANVGADAPDADESFVGMPNSEQQMKGLSSEQKALMIVNAGRALHGEEPLKRLPN